MRRGYHRAEQWYARARSRSRTPWFDSRNGRPYRALRDLQQLHRVAAEDGFLIGVAQELGVEHEVHAHRPIEWIVRAVHDLTHAGFGDEVPQAVLVEDHRVHEQLAAEVLARLLLEGTAIVAIAAGAAAQRIRASAVRCEIAAGVRRTDPQARKTIERAFEDQV